MPEAIFAGIGRITVAAGELEAALAVVAAHELDRNAYELLGKPGESLRAVRLAVAALEMPTQAAFEVAVDRAAQLLAERHKVIHAMWIEQSATGPLKNFVAVHPRTGDMTPADRSTLDDLALRMGGATMHLIELLTNKINGIDPARTTPEIA